MFSLRAKNSMIRHLIVHVIKRPLNVNSHTQRSKGAVQIAQDCLQKFVTIFFLSRFDIAMNNSKFWNAIFGSKYAFEIGAQFANQNVQHMDPTTTELNKANTHSTLNPN